MGAQPASAQQAVGIIATASPSPAGEDEPEERSREVARLQKEIDSLREQHLTTRKRLYSTNVALKGSKQAASRALVQVAKREKLEELDSVAAAEYQLGRCRQTAKVGTPKGTWEGGSESREIQIAKDRIKEERIKIDKIRRELSKKGKARASGASGDSASNGASINAVADAPSTLGEDAGDDEEEDALWEGSEICKHRIAFLGREERELGEREQRLQVDRTLHMKKLKRLEAAERSSFKKYPLLHQERYQLLNMLGRGGFSEVYKAYDLENSRFCAVKIHELGKEMTDQQRQSYIRRAMREYDIQKELKHPRVLALLDCFAISPKAFGTVLELCEGVTLDEYMKRHGCLPEKEARPLVVQILGGLKYMNSNGQKIIHYDLKPGNLFFHCGEIKIADFGLSKVVQESHGESIDLTSQGAGTYWYLPPECFVQAHDEPMRISNKVDVWSTGVIFYEMLFARRPFGHGQSQEALLRTAMVGQAFVVEIPASREFRTTPDDAKEFLKRLLTVEREDRPDVIQAYADPYLRQRGRAVAAGSGDK